MDIVEMRVPGMQRLALFQVRGLLNAETFEQLQTCAQRWIDQGTCQLVIDLAEVTYMSSAGIRALNHIFHAMRTDAPEDSDHAIRDGIKQGTYRSPHLKLARPQPHRPIPRNPRRRANGDCVVSSLKNGRMRAAHTGSLAVISGVL
jgi:ABC-type transporter Mla MlaB component